MDLELWQRTPGFPNYMASTHGRIRSEKNFLKQTLEGDGTQYFNVQVWTTGAPCEKCRLKPHGGKEVTRTVHSLILSAFHGPRPKGMQGAHLDGDSKNNHISNLRYVTPRENSEHKRLHGTNKGGFGPRLKPERIAELRKALAKRPLRQVARETGLGVKRLQRLKNGRAYKISKES